MPQSEYSDLERAIMAMQERKEAAGVTDAEISPNDVTRMTFSGLDLDIDELLAVEPFLMPTIEVAAKANIPAQKIIAGMWIDGLATGVLMERMRRERDDGD